MVPSQPLAFSVPLPLAISTPLQKKLYSPVTPFTNTKFPVLVSSCRQKLDVVTVNEHDAVFPEASVAVQVTVVAPTASVEPDGGLQAVVTPGQLSLAVGLANVTTLLVPIGHDAAATALTFAGLVIVGG
jgi:hypothetical protein